MAGTSTKWWSISNIFVHRPLARSNWIKQEIGVESVLVEDLCFICKRKRNWQEAALSERWLYWPAVPHWSRQHFLSTIWSCRWAVFFRAHFLALLCKKVQELAFTARVHHVLLCFMCRLIWIELRQGRICTIRLTAACIWNHSCEEKYFSQILLLHMKTVCLSSKSRDSKQRNDWATASVIPCASSE